jgi:hypothetical protein
MGMNLSTFNVPAIIHWYLDQVVDQHEEDIGVFD